MDSGIVYKQLNTGKDKTRIIRISLNYYLNIIISIWLLLPRCRDWYFANYHLYDDLFAVLGVLLWWLVVHNNNRWIIDNLGVGRKDGVINQTFVHNLQILYSTALAPLALEEK